MHVVCGCGCVSACVRACMRTRVPASVPVPVFSNDSCIRLGYV